ncbi:retron Eco8 family effector endonuclease [Rummeliibacillus suwonensis]|uniref:retron Eco8 family effector endonuclease n=1 Tax=Rummeliibacillus suwonensis TaxID=1306154 RepID=UPI001AAFAE28|nr:retron Eco8 family effector endonuclease [Rummeliibacillus suwonensis]MBO2535085.1 retron Eco8 family effector endonuclease [Rummeliibacillus suwonensis]
MGIVKISFENIKSLKNTYLNLTDLNVLVGKNGAGKTNIQKYINYFYENLTQVNINKGIFDKENPYNDCAKISIEYNLKAFMEIGKEHSDSEVFKQIKQMMKDEKLETIDISFTQYKNNQIKWNQPYEVRKLIKYLFPIYFLDVRNLNVLDWESIWNLIGDLGQRRSEREEKLFLEFDELLKNTYGKKYLQNINNFQKDLENLEYGVVPYKNSGKFKQLYKFKFNGEVFNYKNNTFDYYSDGANSFNYLKIFYIVLSHLKIDRLKEPLVILDEPEIGLHPNLIDELIKFISIKEHQIQTLLSTHSSRVIKNSIILDNVNIFQISGTNKYSIIKKVKAFEDKKLNKIISDKEASYYFASGILFVEGVTEYELFTNEIIRNIYPIINKVDIFSYNSNNISLDVSHPNQRKMNIPYLLLLDMDKIINYDDIEKKFKVIGDSYNPLMNKEIEKREKYFYGKKRVLRQYRNRIKGISKKVVFPFNENTFSFNDKLYDEFVVYVKYYCMKYNVYPVETTIEGVVINKNNYHLFYEWIMQTDYKDKVKLREVVSKSDDIEYHLNVFRTLVEGKLYTISSLDEEKINSIVDSDIKDGYRILFKLHKLKKSSGWVSMFLEFIQNKLTTNNELQKFTVLFPELTVIMKLLEIIMSK